MHGRSPYLVTIQFHHRVLDLDLALGRHGAGLSEVRRRDRSGPAGSSGESLRAREERSRRDGSLGEGRGRRREKTRRRKRERGRGRRRRGRKGPARESGTEPKSVHCLGDSILSQRMLFGKGVSAMESSQSVWLGGLGFGGLQGSPRRREEQPRERYSAERSKSPKGGEVCRSHVTAFGSFAILANIGPRQATAVTGEQEDVDKVDGTGENYRAEMPDQ